MPNIDQRAESVREFNRFYTRRIGALGDAHLGSPFTLGEMRVLYELAHRENLTAAEIGETLGLDPAYLSRTLRAFKKKGLVSTKSGEDRRRTLLSLTAAGRKAFAPLEKEAHHAIVTMLQPLSSSQQEKVTSAMQAIRAAFDDRSVVSRPSSLVSLRQHRPGDIGWIVHRHGVLYAQEYGYDERFEALVAKIVAGFIENWNPERERCWIAERDGEIVGSIFVVEKTKSIAQLRLLLVEPSARGLGLGRRLVQEVIDFSRRAGYKSVRLWTQSELVSARKIYKAAGFSIVGTEGHESFGKKLDAEVWELKL
jgi:DNA-binding MarR family transcriptional regulator/GNAT superfamily N-acetyltransferase